MTTPRQRIAELTRIEEEREERCAWYILRRLSGEVQGMESWARDTIQELIVYSGVHVSSFLKEQLALWDSFGAADYATGDDPEQDSMMLRSALACAVGSTGWQEPFRSPSPQAAAIAACIAYRVANTTYGPGLFEAGFEISDLRPLFRRVLKEGIDPGIVAIAEDTQPTYTGSRRHPPVVPVTPVLRGQIVDALAARGFASELFKIGSAWHVRSV